jgi:orotate phosphoribosyltransferase-like protein
MSVDKSKVRELFVKGFNKEDIAKILNVDIKEVVLKSKDLVEDSEDLYSALQRDLSKLVLTEMSKGNRDTNVILNSIKLQSELQEKKLNLKNGFNSIKISKNYIYDRDEEIAKMKKEGMGVNDIAKKLKVSIQSVTQALDRNELKLPDELKTLSPTIISETKGLKKEVRLKILQDAFKNNLKRKDVRIIANKIKNQTR